MAQESYEIYAFKDDEWRSDSVYDGKNLAVSLAITLLNKTEHTAVRVIKNSADTASKNTMGRTVFKDSEDDISISDRTWEASIQKMIAEQAMAAEEERKKEIEESIKKARAIKDVMAMEGRNRSKKVYAKIIKIMTVSGIGVVGVVALIYFMLNYFAKT